MIEIEFAPGTPNERTVNISANAKSLNPVRVHTGVGDVRGRIKGDRSLETHAKRQDRMNIKVDGNTIWTGYAIGISHNIGNGDTQLSGDGIGKRLEETKPDYESLGGPVTYQNIPLHDAIRDYWSRTPFDNVTVTDQDTELVAEDDVIQDPDTTSEWDAIFDSVLSDTDPIVIQNSQLELAQSCWVAEAEDARNPATEISRDDFSGGNGAVVTITSEGFQFSISTDYAIEDPVVRLREERTGEDLTVFSIEVDGSEVTTVGDSGGLGWGDEAALGTTLDGNHTISINVDSQTGSDAETELDILTLYDGRFSYNFDNDNGGNGGYLDGPELKPDSVTVRSPVVTTSFNTTAASVTATIDDTSGVQAIGVSNDGGGSFQQSSNTASIDKDFADPGREVAVEFTLGRYGTRDTATPRTGYQGQAIDSYNLSIDGDNLVVIVDLELSRNHFDNLKELHEFGDFLWVIEHDDGPIEDMPVSSFRRGEEQRPAPEGFGNQVNQQPEIQSGVYFNSIYLEGEKRDDGTRPSSEVEDQDAIDEADREISPGVLRDTSITTDAGADFRAQALLDAALSNNDLVGSVTVPPVMVHPGYSRPVDFGPGEDYKTVEKVSLNLGQNNAEATFDFSSRTGLVDDIESLKRDTRGIGNQV